MFGGYITLLENGLQLITETLSNRHVQVKERQEHFIYLVRQQTTPKFPHWLEPVKAKLNRTNIFWETVFGGYCGV